ncbi:MAG: DNA polymerase III subunit delta' [Pseudomonadota bacterium]
MSDDDFPQPDRLDGAPHPRETLQLIGQDAARDAFLTAYSSDRLHHGWLITGPKGVGKATLAWQIARFLIATPPAQEDGLFGAPPPPTSLDIDPEHPVARRMMAGSEPGLFVLKRPYDEKLKRLKQDITIDEVRKLKGFFALSSTDGGHRVVIVDAADEMNVNAANALLKLLEEPPKDTTLLLISHQPSRLLPTIRSRCRELRLGPLAPDQVAQALSQAGQDGTQAAALATLAGGSVGEAITLLTLDGVKLYADLVNLFATCPNMNRAHALKLADSAAGRTNAARFDLMLMLIDLFLARVARTGAMMPPVPANDAEPAVLSKLAPSPHAARHWAALQQDLSARARHGRAVNLDPSALILDMVLKIDQTAARLAAPQGAA